MRTLFFVYRYVYSCACVLFDHATVRRGALLFPVTLAAVLLSFAVLPFAPVSIICAVPFSYALPSLCPVPFAVRLQPNTFNVHFKRFLGLF